MIETVSLIATFVILISLKPAESQLRRENKAEVDSLAGHRFIR